MVNITENTLNAMKESAVRKGQPRPTDDTDNVGGQGRTRAGVPFLMKATSGEINDEKPVVNFDDGFGGLQSKSA